MKKFVISSTIVAVVVLLISYAVLFEGFYIDFHPDVSTQVYFQTKNQQIIKDEKPFFIKGVTLPSTIAGHTSTDYAIDEDTYLHYFDLISQMGANTIYIYTIYDDDFYNALYKYNKNHQKPLYFMQGIQVSSYANHNRNDAYGHGFYDSLKGDSIAAVDVVHGQKMISTNQMKGSGTYFHDVSPYLLAYMIGNEWDEGTLEYTNHNHHRESFQGEYFYTTNEANAFEAMLAKIMNDVVAYETKKYHVQSLMTFSSSPDSDPFEYDQYYGKQIGKYTNLNGEHIQTTKKLQSGYFVSYQLYDYYQDYYHYFSQGQKEELGPLYQEIQQQNFYDSYTYLLSHYHQVPVIISQFGYSSARGSDSIHGPLNEKQQGQAIVETYQTIMKNNCSGAFINSWQDCFEIRMWNTSYAVDITNQYLWNDIQSESTGYGLLGYRSQEMIVDGSDDDWKKKETVIDGDIVLNSTYDEQGLYLFIKKDGLSQDDDIYIPIDTTNQSGSFIDSDRYLHFERKADFLIHLSSKKSQICVQSRYESLRENYLYQIEAKDPFIEYPQVNDSHFVAIRMLCDNKKLTHQNMTNDEKYQNKLYETYETGTLIRGNQNENSLSDYQYGEDCVEIKIPWQLLNVSNPIDWLIHDDYYHNYGVKNRTISKIYLGVATNHDQTIKMKSMSLESMTNLKYKEYLKESYKIVKKYWVN